MDVITQRHALPTATSPATVEVSRQASATRTELPVEKTVNANTESEKAKPINRGSQESVSRPLSKETQRDFDRDEQTNSLVFRSIDVESGEVIQQIPEETTLKLRAYALSLVSDNSPRPSLLDRSI